MQTSSRWPKLLFAALGGLALLVFLAYLLVYVVYAVDLFRWPFDYDQGEGFELYDAILHSRGEWPYRDTTTFPFYASNYPPLFHLLIIPLLPIFGPKLVAGRVVSFVTTLVTAATIGWVVRRESKGWVLPALSGLAFLSSNIVYQVGPLCRLHTTMVMFETLAVAVMAGFQNPKHGRRNLLLGLFLLLCAGYAKQLAVFTVAAALSFVFLRDVKKALLAGVGLALVAGTVFLLIDWATDGQWMLNIISANVNEFDYFRSFDFLSQWFRLYPVLVILSLGLVVYELYWDRLSIYSIWFVFAVGTGLLSGKWGAGPAYFMTSIAAACIMAGRALVRLVKGLAARWPEKRAWAPALIPLLFIVQGTSTVHLPTQGSLLDPLARLLGVYGYTMQGGHNCTGLAYYDSSGYSQLGHLLTEEDYAAGAKILEYVREADGPPFSEEAAFSLLTGEPVVTNPTQLLNLYNNNLLDTTEIIEYIERQEFGVVILRAQFYPPPVLQALGQNYQPVDEVCMNGFYYHILQPRRLFSDTEG
jgi:hypothetical protein